MKIGAKLSEGGGGGCVYPYLEQGRNQFYFQLIMRQNYLKINIFQFFLLEYLGDCTGPLNSYPLDLRNFPPDPT